MALRPGQTALSSLGFQQITSAISNSGNNIQQDTTTAVNSTVTGKYIVMAGRLGQGDDAFKLKSITALKQTGPGQTPAPGTLALLGLGLIGLVAVRRTARS